MSISFGVCGSVSKPHILVEMERGRAVARSNTEVVLIWSVSFEVRKNYRSADTLGGKSRLELPQSSAKPPEKSVTRPSRTFRSCSGLGVDSFNSSCCWSSAALVALRLRCCATTQCFQFPCDRRVDTTLSRVSVCSVASQVPRQLLRHIHVAVGSWAAMCVNIFVGYSDHPRTFSL